MPRDQVTEIVSEMVANVLRVEVEAGAVADIYVTPGDVVQEGDVLLSITA